MRLDRRLGPALGKVERRLPRTVRRALATAGRRGSAEGAQVSVVVAAGGPDAAWLGACLDRLRAQTHRNLEILVVLHGDADACVPVVAPHARDDHRVRPLDAPMPDEAAARNRGADAARGRYLCFVDPEDVVPPTAVEVLARSLERSGSDLAMGREVPLGGPRGVEAPDDPVHEGYRCSTTLGEFPLAVADTGVGNRLYRTGFWRDQGLAFSPPAPVSRPLAVDAFLACGRFDVLPEVTYRRSVAGESTVFSQVPDAMAGVAGWLSEQQVAWSTLAEPEASVVRDAWAYAVCDVWALPFVDDVERATTEQWTGLRDYLGSVVAAMSGEMWRRVRAESRVKVWLLTQDRRAELEHFLSQRWFEHGDRATEVVDGEVHALLPYRGDPDPGVPDSCYVMSEAETRLDSFLRAVRWVAPDVVELDVFSHIDFVDMAGRVPTLAVEAVCAASGTRTPLAVEQWSDPDATVSAGHRYQDYASGACTVRIPLADLLARAAPRPNDAGRAFARQDSLAEWWVELRMEVDGIERRGSLTRSDERGSAGQLSSPALGARSVGGRRVRMVPDPYVGLRVVALEEHPVLLTGCGVRGRMVEGRVSAQEHDVRSVVAVRADGTTSQGRLTPDGDGALRFELDLAQAPRAKGIGGGVWRLYAVDRRGTEHPLGFGLPGPDALWGGASPESDLVVARDGERACELVEADRTVEIESFDVGEGGWRVTGRWPGRVPEGFTVRLRSKRLRLVASSLDRDGQHFEATGPMTADEWGLGEAPIPADLYYLDVLRKGRKPARTVPNPLVVDRLLSAVSTRLHRVVRVAHGRELGARLTPPLGADERGPYAQKQLQLWAGRCEEPLDPQAVYFQSYTGTAATDSQRALHEQLRRSRPDLTCYWAVADHSTQVPDGAQPVLMQSRAWYHAIATSTYLCCNIDFGRWLRKRPGQQLLQTFHGYPAKSMGIVHWQGLGFTPHRIETELDRTSRAWDLILTPCPEMDRYYREQYRYDGEIESAGYPRDDVLVSPDAPAIRERARERLGVPPDKTVVLYAPTWRDDLATRARSAPLVRHLDLESASSRLGDDYVFLMRGHRFHARGTGRSGRTARLIDVTDYPEVNDLILAADAAVLDYSSLRFDFALTGRPMLFLVPDLSSYTGAVRGFLYPFEESAPGPLIEDAEDVVERLRDLEALAAEYKDDYDRFNARFNYLQDGRATGRVVRRFFG